MTHTKRGFSLQARFALTYLLVALGSIVAVIVTSLLTINLLVGSYQQQALQTNATTLAQQIGGVVSAKQMTLTAAVCSIEVCQDLHDTPGESEPPPRMFLLSDATGTLYVFTHESLIPCHLTSESPVSTVLHTTLQGKTTTGTLSSSLLNAIVCSTQAISSDSTYPAPPEPSPDASSVYSYVSVPVHLDGAAARPVIGALFLPGTPQSLLLALHLDLFSPDGLFSNLTILPIILITVLMAGLGAFLSRSITRPIRELTIAVQRVAQGEYTHVVPETRNDELGQLAHSFNYMSSEIARQVETLRMQEQMRKELLANVAHDLAIPLTGIQGNVEALQDGTAQGAQREKSIIVIGEEVARLKRLVAEVQELGRLESPTRVLHLAPVDLNALVEQTVIVLEPEFAQKKVALSTALPRFPLITGDSDVLVRVLLNLLDNALRYTPSDGSVRIHGFSTAQMVSLTIADTGIGMSEEDQVRAFDRFHRADRARTSTTGGNGLGLAIARAIMRAHHGEITVQSRPGEGTQFTCTFPIPAGQSTQKLPAP